MLSYRSVQNSSAVYKMFKTSEPCTKVLVASILYMASLVQEMKAINSTWQPKNIHCHVYHNFIYIFREFLHWLVIINSEANDQEKVLVPFMPSSPPEGSGIHRYVFLMFTSDALNFHGKEIEAPAKRAKFSISKFVQNNNLGKLTAINFYTTSKEK